MKPGEGLRWHSGTCGLGNIKHREIVLLLRFLRHAAILYASPQASYPKPTSNRLPGTVFTSPSKMEVEPVALVPIGNYIPSLRGSGVAAAPSHLLAASGWGVAPKTVAKPSAGDKHAPSLLASAIISSNLITWPAAS